MQKYAAESLPRHIKMGDWNVLFMKQFLGLIIGLASEVDAQIAEHIVIHLR